MEGTLHRTIFRVAVLRVGVRVDPETQRRLESIAAGRTYTDEAAQQVAGAMLDADDVLIVVEFQRSVSYERFMRAIEGDIRRARDANLVREADYRSALEALPTWFRPLEARGMRRGDLLVYRLHPDALQTRLITSEGQIWVDRIDVGPGPRRTFLASYFAPDSRLRRTLIRSLFDQAFATSGRGPEP
jgi:hypothetical protein